MARRSKDPVTFRNEVQFVACLLIASLPSCGAQPMSLPPPHAAHIGQLMGQTISTRLPDGNIVLVQGVPLHQKSTLGPVIVGFVDSGVDLTHPQLDGLTVVQKDFTRTGLDDTIGHGTVMVLLYLAHADANAENGPPTLPVFLNAKVVDAKAPMTDDAVIAAIRWEVAQKAKVINLSLGFEGAPEDFVELCRVIRESTGTLFVAAAGNSGPNVPIYPRACKTPNILGVETDADTSGRGDIQVPTASLPSWLSARPLSEQCTDYVHGLRRYISCEKIRNKKRQDALKDFEAFQKEWAALVGDAGPSKDQEQAVSEQCTKLLRSMTEDAAGVGCAL
jgi:subtilisin family serine protease